MTKTGIDVSEHNGMNTDYRAMKAHGVDFVIIRAGYGRLTDQRDICFDLNYKNAKAAGLDVGAYWFSYANSPKDAKREAETCLKVIEGKKFEYPIYFDIENQWQLEQGAKFCDPVITNFCTALESKGYFAGVYCSSWWYTNSVSKSVRDRFAFWVAEWDVEKPTYAGAYGMWQYGLRKFDGVSYDFNMVNVDYPSIIKSKGFNGYGELTHTVKAGETLTFIADKYGVSVDDITRNNKLITTGQQLIIKG